MANDRPAETNHSTGASPGEDPGTFAREFFTATNISIVVGMILLLMSTGILEVIALGVMLFWAAMGWLDLVLNVTHSKTYSESCNHTLKNVLKIDE